MSESPNPEQSNSEAPKKQGFSWANLRESAKVNLESGRGMFEGIWEKFQDLPETNYQVGRQLVMKGAIKDAIFRFRVALWFDANHTETHYAIGCCYFDLGDRDKAAQHLIRALQLNPAYEEARFILARVRPDLIADEQRPRRMPANMMADYFEAIAPRYDEQQEIGRYNGPAVMEHYINAELDERRLDLHMLDMGCGTGLLGARMRNRMRHIVGVDSSRPMLEQAVGKQQEGRQDDYDALVEDEASAHMRKDTPHSVDVITALNMLQYSGDLTAYFETAKRMLREDGMFVFTFYPNTQTADFGLVPQKGYFGHNPDYIRGLAKRHGLVERHISDALLYPQVMHNIAVFKNDDA